MRFIALAAVAAVLAGTSAPASAQSARPYGSRAAPGYEAPTAQPSYPDRGYRQYSQRPGETGIIRWNTPNADGNFGGPGGGGGGGGR